MELCERKKKKENERWEKEAGRVSRESEAWEIVNRERKKRKGIKEDIEMKEWKGHFMRLLGGVERRTVKESGDRGEREGQRDKEEEIDRREVRKVLGRMKDGKASGIDGIPREVWRYGGEELEGYGMGVLQ